MKFTPANEAEIKNYLYYIRNKYPWLGILVFDKTELKTKEELLKHISEKDWEDLKT